ncbi:MAG: hypothetical protein ACE5FO_13520 [Parvularculaceae bacterium]
MMTETPREKPQRFSNADFTPLKIAGYYALAGGLWIAFSDAFLTRALPDPAIQAQLQTVKGWAFVLCTALLIFVLTQRLVRGLQNEAAVRKRLKKRCASAH